MEDPNSAVVPEVILDSPENKGIEEISVDEGTSSQTENTQEKSSKDSTEQERTKTTSPEPNCAICLGKLENKSFTDSCFHTFCFVCLLEWSKVQAVCPLCKQPFKSIIHNVRSFEDYDQYHLRNEEQAMADLDSRRFRFHTTMTNERWWEQQRREQERQMALLRRPSRMTLATHWHRQRQAVTSGYRRRIYASDMRVVEVRSASGRSMRYREVSPEFYRSNPACLHRLVPWLNRELNVLLNQHEDHVQFVLELILDLVKRFSIQSEEFFQHIEPFTGRRTEHFVHEFYSFARSPYDMHAYDQRAVYNEPVDQPVHTIESSDDSSNQSNPNVVQLDNDEDDIIVVSPTEASSFPADEATTSQDHPYSSMFSTASQNMDIPSSLRLLPVDFDLAPLFERVQNFLSAVDNRTTGASGWDSPILTQPIPSGNALDHPSTSAPVEVDESTGSSEHVTAEEGPSTSAEPTQAESTTTVLPPITLKKENESSLEDDDSDSSSVLVIGYEKPWDERSAEEISTEDEMEVQAALKAKKAEEEKEKRRLEKIKCLKKKKSKSRSRSRTPQRRRDRSRERHHRSPPKSYRITSRHYSDSSPESRRHRRSRSRSVSPRYRSSREYSSRVEDHDRERRRRDRGEERHRLNRSRSRDTATRYRDEDRYNDRIHRNRSSRSRDQSDRHRRRRSRSRSRSETCRDSRRSSIPRAYQISRSRSRSVEVVFRRSHKSKHKESRKRARDGNSCERERINLVSPSSRRSEHSSRSVRSNSSVSASVHSPHETATDGHHYKKNPTGHKKSTKSKDNREGTSRATGFPSEATRRNHSAVMEDISDSGSRHTLDSDLTREEVEEIERIASEVRHRSAHHRS